MTKKLHPAWLGFVALFAAACAARPELLARSGAVPMDMDLTGQWQLRGQLEMPHLVGEGIVLPPANRKAPPRERKPDGEAVQVFLEMGRSLKVTQTEHSLFFAYDRAVVEEYTFGEKRIVAVGPIEAQRVSGWVGEKFLVETLDEEGALLTETWWLADGGGGLHREIRIQRGEREIFSARQAFDRS